MSEQPLSGPLGQFLGDLSAIRAKRNVSLDALREATKVYPNVIAQFERDGLKDHPLFNSLYVRAFIRSYARALGIPADDVLQSYDRALEGDYNRQLAIEYLDLPASEIESLQKAQAQSIKAEPVFTVDKFEFNQPARKTRPSGKIESAAASGAAITFIPKSKEEDEGSTLAVLTESAKNRVQSFFETGKRHAFVQWGLLAGGLGLGLFVILQLLSFQSDTGDNGLSLEPGADQRLEEKSPAPPTPDVVTALPAQQIPVHTRTVPLVLGDSIPIHVVAASGKLDPFRLKKDADMRRPYWLDEGDSMVFFIKDVAVIEDHLEAMKILIEGSAYPIYETDSLAKVVISRDSIQAFLENN